MNCETQLSGVVTVPPNFTGGTTSLGHIDLPSALAVEFDGCLSASNLDIHLIPTGGILDSRIIDPGNNASVCTAGNVSAATHGFYKNASFLYVLLRTLPFYPSLTLIVWLFSFLTHELTRAVLWTAGWLGGTTCRWWPRSPPTPPTRPSFRS